MYERDENSTGVEREDKKTGFACVREKVFQVLKKRKKLSAEGLTPG